MKAKYVLLTMVLIALIGFSTLQIRAEIPIIEADTVFAGFTTGDVGGIAITDEGKTLYLIHGSQPVEIDIETHQILRRFEGVPNKIGTGNSPIIIKSQNYITAYESSSDLYGVKNFGGNVFWDLNTGKIIKSFPDVYLLTDGEKYFTRCYSNNYTKEYIGRFDINTFKITDSIYLPKDLPGSGYAEWSTFGIIPNTNKVLFGVNRYYEFQEGKREYVLSELYLLDFDTKNYTKIKIPYESGQKSSNITSINVSETGKYNIISIDIDGLIYQYIYDNNFKYIYKLNKFDFEIMTSSSNIYSSYVSMILNDDILIFYIASNDLKTRKMFTYNIGNKSILKYLGFKGSGVFDKVSQKIALYGILGITGIYTLDALAVRENKEPTHLFQSIQYKENNLVINSTACEKAEITITDYNGNLLNTIKDVFLQAGVNTINIYLNLPNGVYFCILKTNTGSNSYKFMVNK